MLIKEARERVKEGLERVKFYNSTKVISDFCIDDVLLMAIFSEQNVCLVGSSGTGKTLLARSVLSSVFSDFSDVRCYPGLKKEELFGDLDFEVIKSGGHLRDAFKSSELVNSDALLIDEINRAPTPIQNIFLDVLQGELSIEGKRYPVGRGGYFVVFATANIGNRYAGTFTMDPALKERFSIEIPVDCFAPSFEDKERVIRERKSGRIVLKEDERGAVVERGELVQERDRIREIKLSEDAILFLQYLEMLDICEKSPTGRKRDSNFLPSYCKSCRFLDKGCRFIISGLSISTIRDIASFSRTYAAFKGHEDVKLEDVIEVCPLFLYKGLVLDSEFEKNFWGNRYEAVRSLLQGFIILNFKERSEIVKDYLETPWKSKLKRMVLEDKDVHSLKRYFGLIKH